MMSSCSTLKWDLAARSYSTSIRPNSLLIVDETADEKSSADCAGAARLGGYFAEVLLLDQGTDAARARAELGCSPSHPSRVDEFRHGSHRK
jgi:hypothetical protein